MRRIAIHGERHDTGGPGQFVLGRSEALCPLLLEKYRAQARLVYLDPPFGTGDTFSMQTGGEARITAPTYTDAQDAGEYDAMMRTILTACHGLLRADGSLYLHVDYRKSARMRLLLDDIFGENNFVNEIIWAYKSGGRATKHFSRKHDTIFLYRKSAKQFFNIAATGVPRGPARRNHMKRGVDEAGRVFYSIRTGGRTYTYYEDTPVYPSDVWDDIEHLHQRDPERTGYNTQKPEALLRRILDASSEPGDLVMDLFSGSGTTAAVAAQSGRSWVAADASPLALCTLRRRLLQGNRSFFDAAHAMALTYTLNDLPETGLSLARRDGRVCAQAEAPLAYIALGVTENGVFLPRAYAFLPQPGEALWAERENTVLQAVDLYGKQGFFTLDPA